MNEDLKNIIDDLRSIAHQYDGYGRGSIGYAISSLIDDATKSLDMAERMMDDAAYDERGSEG